jgi:folate-binding protein YgfZ
MNSSWQDFLTAQGAAITNECVAHFGQPQQELLAAAQGTIMADLSQLGLLQISGEDAVTFLQGQLTNDVKLLDGGNSQYAGYCTAKGRLLGLFLAFAHHDHLHLQCNGALTQTLLKRLKMYVLRSKVRIDDVSDSIVRIGLGGAGAANTLKRLFSAVPQAPLQLLNLDSANIIRLPGPTPRYEIFTTVEHATDIWGALRQHCAPVGSAAWDWLEIQAGIPDVTPATQEAFVPQMLNLDAIGAISFKKGCYTGQEIVARTHYLGKVKRRTQLVHIDVATPPQPGDVVYGVDSSEPVGLVVRAAPAPTGGYDLLAEVRVESMAAGALRLAADGPSLQLQGLPYSME